MVCKICSSEITEFDNAKVLGRFDVQYYKCKSCGAIFTETPYWLGEAYSEAISSLDVGLVSRNLNNAPILSRILDIIYPPPEYKFLDFAGGYGLLVRMMRDNGYDFYWYDKYAKDIFNPSFVDISVIDSHYDAMTAYEVFEHLENPVEELKIACNNTETLIFSTVIIPEGLEKISDWWYFSPETGQHITFYTHKALAILGGHFGMNYISLGNLHIYTKKQIDLNEFAKALQTPSAQRAGHSLLQPDYQRALQEIRKRL